MGDTRVTRKLTAILYADVAGYSRLTGEDEVGTHRRLSAGLDLISEAIEGRGGNVVHYAGDAVLADFSSVVAAVECAVEVQRRLAARNAEAPADKRLQFRIGVNLGEVIVDRDDIYGDGVNIAARLESLAEAGGVCVSETVHAQVRDKIDVGFQYMGRQKVKNVAEPVAHYRVLMEEAAAAASGGAGIGRRGSWQKTAGRLVLVALVAAAGVAVWQVAAPPAVEPPGPPSLAVMPFRTIGGGPDHEVFSQGLTEELMAALSTDDGLRVIAGVARPKGEAADPRAQARALNARYVFDGSVRGSARLRITAQLIDARTGFLLWGGRYDRAFADALALQAEVSVKIVTTLAEKLDRIRRQQDVAAADRGPFEYMLVALEPVGRVAEEAVALSGDLLTWLEGRSGK